MANVYDDGLMGPVVDKRAGLEAERDVLRKKVEDVITGKDAETLEGYRVLHNALIERLERIEGKVDKLLSNPFGGPR